MLYTSLIIILHSKKHSLQDLVNKITEENNHLQQYSDDDIVGIKNGKNNLNIR